MEEKALRRWLLLISYGAFLALTVSHFSQVWALWTGAMEIFMPFFAGFAIAFILTQPCDFFTKCMAKLLPHRKESTHNGLAVALTYFSVFFLLFALISVVIPKLMESVTVFTESIKVYTANVQSWLNGLAANTDNALLAELSVDVSGLFSYLFTYVEEILETSLSAFSVAATHVVAVTGGVFSVVYNLVVALVFSVYMLGDRKNLVSQGRRILFAYVPKKVAYAVDYVLAMSARTFSKFVAGQLLEACILGGLCALGMLFIQSDYALLIGIIVGLSSLVPVAGAYIGGSFAFVLLFMVSPMRSLIFLVFLVVLQQFEGNVIYPRVVGSSIGLPGLWVVFAVIIGGGLFGLVGVLLSVPCLSILYALIRLDVEKREGKRLGFGEEAMLAAEGSTGSGTGSFVTAVAEESTVETKKTEDKKTENKKPEKTSGKKKSKK